MEETWTSRFLEEVVCIGRSHRVQPRARLTGWYSPDDYRNSSDANHDPSYRCWVQFVLTMKAIEVASESCRGDKTGGSVRRGE